MGASGSGSVVDSSSAEQPCLEKTASIEVADQVEEVSPEEEDWRMVNDLFRERISEKHMEYFKRDIQFKRLFRIKPSSVLQEYQQEVDRQKLGSPELLFHGTTPANTERILLSGFSLPRRPGLFGRGIYFARDPLKSAAYAHAGARGRGISRTLMSKALSVEEHAAPMPVRKDAKRRHTWQVSGGAESVRETHVPKVTSERRPKARSLPAKRHAAKEQPPSVQQMLLNEVYLGKQRTVRSAKPDFGPSHGMSRPQVLKAAGFQDYNSLRAPGGALGCVKVTEIVVYQECQAIPRFLIEFEQIPVISL